jgi:hypothetical protein
MALGRKNVPVAGTNSGADVFRLAGFLGDDNLIRHEGLGWRMGFESAGHERLVNNTTSQATFWWVRGQAAKPGRERRPAVDGARQSAARRRSRGCRLRHRRESSSFGAAVLFAFQGLGLRRTGISSGFVVSYPAASISATMRSASSLGSPLACR